MPTAACCRNAYPNHQPNPTLTQVPHSNLRRSSIYAMFDLLLLLSEGRTMFFGPASEAVRARIPRIR